MKFEKTQVMNFEGALRGMRAPMASWAKSDSEFGICHLNEVNTAIDKFRNKYSIPPEQQEYYIHAVCAAEGNWKYNLGALSVEEAPKVKPNYRHPEEDHWVNYALIGPNDMDLCRRLINGGSEHRKFLRQIMVSVDITAPLYWWKEFDTYKVGTTANSTSTMHKLASTPITLECFEIDDYCPDLVYFTHDGDTLTDYTISDIASNIIEDMEALRQKYLETKDKRYWKELIRWLPNGWLQTRAVTMNYENLRSMYHQRENHKLSEWHQFCKWVEDDLPYSKELIID